MPETKNIIGSLFTAIMVIFFCSCESTTLNENEIKVQNAIMELAEEKHQAEEDSLHTLAIEALLMYAPSKSDSICFVCMGGIQLGHGGCKDFIMGDFRKWLSKNYPNFRLTALEEQHLREKFAALTMFVRTPSSRKKDLLDVLDEYMGH